MDRQGASEAELAALQRLEEGRAELVDLERLATLADFAGLDWGELFPEWKASRECTRCPAAGVCVACGMHRG